MSDHRLADGISLALHTAVAERLRADPSLVERARERVTSSLQGGHLHPYYAQRWLEILSRPIEAICAILQSTTEDATALRQATPFTGVLDSATRWRIWRAVRAEAGP